MRRQLVGIGAALVIVGHGLPARAFFGGNLPGWGEFFQMAWQLIQSNGQVDPRAFVSNALLYLQGVLGRDCQYGAQRCQVGQRLFSLAQGFLTGNAVNPRTAGELLSLILESVSSAGAGPSGENADRYQQLITALRGMPFARPLGPEIYTNLVQLKQGANQRLFAGQILEAKSRAEQTDLQRYGEQVFQGISARVEPLVQQQEQATAQIQAEVTATQTAEHELQVQRHLARILQEMHRSHLASDRQQAAILQELLLTDVMALQRQHELLQTLRDTQVQLLLETKQIREQQQKLPVAPGSRSDAVVLKMWR
ncbi:MAG: hypothetical protein NZ482_01900 [Gloeomargarita sp. SKYG98]|nr:hypothetical protein [Gloeomargarita sp. SKYG98]